MSSFYWCSPPCSSVLQSLSQSRAVPFCGSHPFVCGMLCQVFRTRDPWEGLQQNPLRFFLFPPHPLWSRSCLSGAMSPQLAGSWLSLPFQHRLTGAIWNEQPALALPPTPSPVLPGSPQGLLSSDRNRHRHRDLLVALSCFSRLRFHLVLFRESP